MKCVSMLVLFLLIPNLARTSKILGVFPSASFSHQVVYQAIWKELSLKGHELVVITPEPLRDLALENLKEIDVSMLYEHFKEVTRNSTESQTHWDLVRLMPNWLVKTTEDMLNHPNVSALLSNNETSFDLVIAEFLSPVVTAFAYRYDCPFIGVTSFNLVSTAHEAIGNPAHPLLYPDILTSFGEDMTFLEKVDAVIFNSYWRLKYYTHDLPVLDLVMRKYFGEGMPYLGDLERNVSLVFLNTNPIIHGARPYSTGVIELERMHIKRKEGITPDLQSFLDDAKEGVIYFSLGSNVKSIHINDEKRRLILSTFSELPYKFLWKFESEHFPNKSSNVKVKSWFPQQEILGHPNVKLFITQGGLQSMEEAIANETPMLALPILGDQHANAMKITKLGIGLNLELHTLTKEKFMKSMLEILQNSRYKKRIKQINELMLDRPMNGLEKAVWWTEYVLRHKGTPFFRNHVVDMPWYQYFLLDIISFILLSTLLSVFLIYMIISKIVRQISGALETNNLKVS